MAETNVTTKLLVNLGKRKIASVKLFQEVLNSKSGRVILLFQGFKSQTLSKVYAIKSVKNNLNFELVEIKCQLRCGEVCVFVRKHLKG